MLLELLLGVVIGLLLLCAGLLGWLLRRSGHDALLRVTARLEALRESQERITRAVVDEIGFGRREAQQAAEEQRAQLARPLAELRDALLEGGASDAELRKRQLDELCARVEARAQRADAALQQLLQSVGHGVRGAQEATATLLVEHQLELQGSLRELQSRAASREAREADLVRELAAATRDTRQSLDQLGRALSGWLEQADAKLASASAHTALQTERAQRELASALGALRDGFAESSGRLGEAQARERGALATAVESALGSFQDDHARRLERIRHAVEERLPAALDQRLSDAFRPASQRLDEIRRVLDELRALAAHSGTLHS